MPALIVGVLATCSDPSGPPSASSVVITPAEATLVAIDETATFAATARDAQGRALSGKAVNWSSSDPAIAQIDQNGLVTAGGNGTATITATVDGVAGTAS